MLDLLCPMHMHVAGDGRIAHVGPTLRKLRPALDLTGRPVMDVFDILRPEKITDIDGLIAHLGRKLHLRFRDTPETALKGLAAPAPSGEGVVINLSFGISILDAVGDYALSSGDFAATDLAVEMLYLVEAKSAAMDASRKLNQRLQGAKQRAEQQALTDPLTGLANRRGLEAYLDRLLHRGAVFAILHIDLDFFKQVNDQQGHAAGDFVLSRVAQILQAETRDRDLGARVGGDEFMLILEAPSSRAAVERIAERLIVDMQKPIAFKGHRNRISCSIGIVFSDTYVAPEAEMLFRDADTALYASKKNGRSQHTVFNPPGSAATPVGHRVLP